MNNVHFDQYLIPWTISQIVGLLILFAAWKKPVWARYILGFLFLAAGVFNWITSIRTPEAYMMYSDTAIDMYRDFINGWFRDHIRLVVGAVASGQLLIGTGMLAGRRWQALACLGIIVFLIAIAPLGVGSAFPFSVTVSIAAFLVYRHGQKRWEVMSRIVKVLTKRFPRNFIIGNPFWGSFIIMAFCILFAILYRPLGTHESRYFNYPVTMAVYCFLSSLCVFVFIKILNRIRFFSERNEWTILKELSAIVLVLSVMGTAIYFLAFLLEPPSDRWNLSTFFDSWKSTFLVGVIPFAFFTLSHYRHLFVEEISKDFEPDTGILPGDAEKEDKILIGSLLKKEELSFYPHEFIYAESDGNYVTFYIADDQGTHKKVIRNAISSIEQQLENIPFFTRTHRAYIVNVKRILSKQGNSLGYRLKLSGTDAEIPVSRQKISAFDQLLSRYK